MENTLWNKLPGDLQILVLVRLPLLDLRRLSCTCKYFHSLLSDPSFAIHYDRNRLCHPTFFVASRWLEKHMHKTVLNSGIFQEGWNVMIPWRASLFDYLEGSRWWLSSYGDGFMCFQGLLGPLCNEKPKFLVFNPLFAHESKTLTLPPEADSGRKLYTAIAFDRKNGVCKLIVWRTLPKQRVITFVYNLKEGTWKTITGYNGISTLFSIGGCAQLINERFLCWLCTDIISSVNTVLVFDVEEESWSEPIPVGKGSFICTAQHEKQLCVISKTNKEEEMIFGLCKFDMKQRVWGLVEFIPPPTIIGETDYHVWGGSEFFWVEEWNENKKRYYMWVYDIAHHFWLNLGHLEMGMEGSLFRLGV